MANVLLAPIYRDVYGEQFSSSNFSDRMEMQKLIYLLQEAGISIGDYNFHWYKHGPYSQQLQNDILATNGDSDYQIRYSETANIIVNRLTALLNMDTDYPRDTWAECLASLQYLRSNVFSINSSDGEILNELIRRKSHLNKPQINELALNQLKTIFN